MCCRLHAADCLQCMDHDWPFFRSYGHLPVRVRGTGGRQVLALSMLLFPARDVWGEVCPGALDFLAALAAKTITLTSPIMSNHEVVQAILWTDVVGQCFNEARASHPPRLIKGVEGKNMIVARLRFLGVQCDSTRHTIQSMRSLFLAV